MLCLAMTIFSFLCLLRISDISFYSHITLAKSFFLSFGSFLFNYQGFCFYKFYLVVLTVKFKI